MLDAVVPASFISCVATGRRILAATTWYSVASAAAGSGADAPLSGCGGAMFAPLVAPVDVIAMGSAVEVNEWVEMCDCVWSCAGLVVFVREKRWMSRIWTRVSRAGRNVEGMGAQSRVVVVTSTVAAASGTKEGEPISPLVVPSAGAPLSLWSRGSKLNLKASSHIFLQ